MTAARRPRPEDELIRLCVATADHRRAHGGRISALAAQVDWDVLWAALARQRLTALVAARLAANGPLPGRFEAAAGAVLAAQRSAAAGAELIGGRIAGRMNDGGIRVLPLKGPHLARMAFGDPALRATGDIDLLVDRADLVSAGAVIEGFGFRLDARTHWDGSLPLLHFRYEHPDGLPPIELHWRVHWYEESFATAMLAAAVTGEDGLLRATPRDELAALLLMYARDGFTGLRLASDLAAWWDARGPEVRPGGLESLADRHPALRPALASAAWAAHRRVGLPAARLIGPPRGRRAAVAARIGDWTLGEPDAQLTANAHLTDVLLSPPRARRSALRRHAIVSPASMRTREDALAGVAAPLLRLAATERAARVVRRWAIALWRVRGGREWVAGP